MDVVLARRSALFALVVLLLPLLLLRLPVHRPAPPPSRAVAPVAAPRVTRPLPTSRHPWTLAEARAALDRQPDNNYLQYVVLQLARQEKRLGEVVRSTPLFAARRPAPDLFNPFADTLAIQADLQREVLLAADPATAPAPALDWRGQGRLIDTVAKLERAELLAAFQPGVPFPAGLPWFAWIAEGPKRFWLYEQRLRAAAPTARPPVPLEVLTGPRLPTRTWPTPSEGERPAVSELARLVPDDFYFAEFRSLNKLLEALDVGQTWAHFLSTQIARDANDRRPRRRLQAQLALDAASALPAFVDRVAVVGSDPFLQEGSDVTILLQLKDPQAFHRRQESVLERVVKERGARKATGTVQGVEVVALTTPDRLVSVYAATPRPNLHVRSNSPVALRRVLAAIQGEDEAGQPVRRLGDTSEFLHARARLNADEEDGLLYFSGPFLRRLYSPRLQLTEARRLVAFNHLRMIAHAAQLYRTQFGKAPASLDDLARTGCAPGRFNEGRLACPSGGTYALSADGTLGVCSVHGTTEFLTPCCELPLTEVTASEAEAYRDFVTAAERSETALAESTAVRLHVGPRRVRVEALVLARPGRSWTSALGGPPENLEPLPVPSRVVLSLSARLDKDAWLPRVSATPTSAQLAPVSPAAALLVPPTPSAFPTRVPWQDLAQLGVAPARLRTFLERGVGNQVGVHFYDAPALGDVNLPALLAANSHRDLDLLAALLFVPAYVALPVRDAKVVDDFLAHLDPVLLRASTWRTTLLGVPVAGEFYHLGPATDPAVRALGVRVGPARWRCFLARIGDGLYVANQPAVLDDLRAATTERLRAPSADRGPSGHLLLRLRPARRDLSQPGHRLTLAENQRAACCRNLSLLSAAARAFSFAPPVSTQAADHDARQRLVLLHARKMYGLDFACPDGGQYLLSADGKSFRCTVHGTPDQPRQPAAPLPASAAARLLDGLADVSVTLTTTGDGLRVVVTAERK